MPINKRSILISILMTVSSFTMANQQQDDLLSWMDTRYQHTASMAKQIWDFAELGYLEQKSSQLLQDKLAAEGFVIETGVAGIPTAFTATYGSKGTVIGILAEFDALPGLNQAAEPFRSPVEGKHAAHGCGHNLFGAGSVSAAIAVKKWLKDSGQDGVIRLYGTPAEEGGSGKVYMVREGLFDDVDFAIHWHPGSNNNAEARSSLANRSAKFRFHGISTHASGAPHKGRSALDGVEAFNHMVNLMREHVPQETRIHYVITKGGVAPNVVPDFAEVFYYIRHPNAETLKEIWARVEDAAKGAAMGTGTQVNREIIHGNHSLLPVEALSKAAHKHLTRVGGIEYNAEEQAFAEKIYQTLDKPSAKLGSEKEIRPYRMRRSGGSTDVGDVSMVVPTVRISTASYVPGTSSHSWQSAAAAGMSIGFKGAHNASKVMALMAIELYQNAQLRADAKAEFERRRGDNFKYVPLLGDRQPPLEYRK
ncbi:amidohydrolase [Endozoicomonas sp. G2_1]|uniref:amidohydrolase n=1 Tax=Endozoicomonas sp. G2_1 TaxID=2821091 RepID=UPI001ADB035A|nr:amidohydrolase [Endozoicomonas sp. G2_1]MBO9490308.1 amidohydrolase [Endozoicomonas sp. G2_1]